MRRPTLLALFLFCCASRADAAVVTRAFTVTGFDRVAVSGAYDVTVRVGPGVAVRATGDGEALDRLTVAVEGGILRIRPDNTRSNSWSNNRNVGKVTVAVTVPSLRGAAVSGSGSLTIDRVRAEEFQASLAGSGDMAIGALQAERLSAAISGSGDLTAAGKAGLVKATVAGSGSIAAADLMAGEANVSVIGSGDVTLGVSRDATVSALGSGDVTITGTAKCDVTQRGSGSVTCGRTKD